MGCGLGSESILSGLIGCHVTGLDLNENFIYIARKRIKYFEKKFNTKFKIRFLHENFFNHLEKYDLIWINEAISHIYPLKSLILHCYNLLKKKGKLIISDPNKLNPIIYYLYSIRPMFNKKIRIAYEDSIREDPKTGEKVIVVYEKYLKIHEIKNLLSTNFKILKIATFGFFPYSFFKLNPKICIFLENNIIQKLPLFKLIAGGYVAISLKA